MTLASSVSAAREAAPFLANHLWQSTCFTALVGLLTLAFRRDNARVRFGLWQAASLKFLIPFAWLIELGNRLAQWHRSPQAAQRAFTVIQEVSQPFLHGADPSRTNNHLALWYGLAATLWICGTTAILWSWQARWRSIRRVQLQGRLVSAGREFDVLRRLEKSIGIARPIPIWTTASSMEPGVFGALRPVLLWPEGISGHLSDSQLTAILAHELEHVRHRDNLAASLHMTVEAIFWFHPLVWWIGARLVEEREWACDEQVLQLGSDRETYAESLLKACRFCVQTPLPCVAGVAGSNLKRRVTRIMNFQAASHLTFGRKLLLTAIGSAALTGPVVFGVMHAPPLLAQTTYTASLPKQSFETATVKPNHSTECKGNIEFHPGRFTANAVTVRRLIEFAYGIDEYQLAGGPGWIDTDCYDVDASWSALAATQFAPPAGPPPPPPPPGKTAMTMQPLQSGQLQAMVITLLSERFDLKLKGESQTLPIEELMVTDAGAKLTETPRMPPPPSFNGEPIIAVRSTIRQDGNEISMSNGPASALAGFLSQVLHRKVVDKTGLTGTYDITLHLTPNEENPDAVSDSLREQLGLRLESSQGQVNVFAIDQIEKPAEN